MDFKLQMLQEYYESGSSMYSISKKYGVDNVTFLRWVKLFESKGLQKVWDEDFIPLCILFYT